jgi:hypothetical protein
MGSPSAVNHNNNDDADPVVLGNNNDEDDDSDDSVDDEEPLSEASEESADDADDAYEDENEDEDDNVNINADKTEFFMADEKDVELASDLLKSVQLESDIDKGEDVDKKPSSITKEKVIKTDGDDFVVSDGPVGKRYDELSKMDNNRQDMKGCLINLVQFLEGLDSNNYDGMGLENLFNEKWDGVGNKMSDTFIKRGHPEMAERINLGNRFSLLAVIVIWLHYAPLGSKSVDNIPFDCCRDDQCCIDCMKRYVPNFLCNEQEHGSDAMMEMEWNFGGKGEIDIENKRNAHRSVVSDLIPCLSEKGKTEAEMKKSYAEIADKLGLDDHLDIMVISFCWIKMHVLLSSKNNNTGKLHILVASSAVAQYVFGYKGTDKYFIRISGRHFELVFCIHPEVSSSKY